jgi:hypothetical protein
MDSSNQCLLQHTSSLREEGNGTQLQVRAFNDEFIRVDELTQKGYIHEASN